MKHTPGPWVCANGSEVHDCETIFGDTPNQIAQVKYPYHEETEREANARLIASAPELLESLVDWFSVMADKAREERPEERLWKGRLERARAAIAKAKGENQ